jgi:hypothetical protein
MSPSRALAPRGQRPGQVTQVIDTAHRLSKVAEPIRKPEKDTHLRNGAKAADRTILRYGFTSQAHRSSPAGNKAAVCASCRSRDRITLREQRHHAATFPIADYLHFSALRCRYRQLARISRFEVR